MMKQHRLILCMTMLAALLTACGGGGGKKNTSSSSISSSSISSSSISSSSISSSSISSSLSSSSISTSEMSSSSVSSMMSVKYSITVTNLTAGQPFGRIGLILHKPEYQAFKVGMAASVGLETLAEGGNPTQFLAEAAAQEATYMTQAGMGMIAPGSNETITIETEIDVAEQSMLRLSFASMPVFTNDAFVGLNSFNLGDLNVGDAVDMATVAYDAGTERNTETMATVPAAGGQGFDPARDDDPGVVTMHSGVITQDDGLETSVLSSVHRWDNPIARVRIMRVAP